MSPSEVAEAQQQIRAVIDLWLKSSREGDLPTLMNLMTEDVAFLTPGNPPMRRADFEANSKAMQGTVRLEAHPDVQEITIQGDLAVVWLHLEVAVTPVAGGDTTQLAGHILSVLRRGIDGQWRIWRDANTLTPIK